MAAQEQAQTATDATTEEIEMVDAALSPFRGDSTGSDATLNFEVVTATDADDDDAAETDDSATDADTQDQPTPPGGATPEQETETAPASDGADDDDEDVAAALSDDATKGRPDLRKLREKYDANKRRIRELEEKLAASAPPAATTTEPPTTPTGVDVLKEDWFEKAPDLERPKASPAVILDTIARAANNETMNDGSAASMYQADAERQFQLLSPDDVLAVMQSARSGHFGENSQNVLALAQSRLAEVMARDAARKADHARYESLNDEWRQSLAEVSAAEGMNDPNSEQFKAFQNALAVVSQFIPKDVLKRIPKSAKMTHELSKLIRANAATADYAAVVAERDKLKDELTRITGAVGGNAGGTGGKPKAKPKTAEQELAETWASLRAGR